MTEAGLINFQSVLSAVDLDPEPDIKRSVGPDPGRPKETRETYGRIGVKMGYHELLNRGFGYPSARL